MNRATLLRIIRERRSFLCVGLDPELEKLPQHLSRNAEGVLEFNKGIIDATRDLCVAYKPNLAFYEALGAEGWKAFYETVQYIGKEHFIIADAKRGDIGNTSRLYAKAFFQQADCDAVTVAPYMGADSVQPFLEFDQHWVILLALTSNIGSNDFQLTPQAEATGAPLFEKVIKRATIWGTPENLMFVIGATHPDLFRQIRTLVPNHFLLVPGVGAQGGDLDAICATGLNDDVGLLINASRSIIYAGSGPDFAQKAREEAHLIQQQMERYC